MILNSILDIIMIILILISVVAMAATVIGFIRLPDELTKIHAAGVTGAFEFKFLLAIAFLFLVAPVSAHIISISAIIFNKKVYSKNQKDEAKKVLDDIQKLNKQ